MKKEIKYVLVLTAIYFAVSLVGILHHELWLDEAHHWLLARDSNSFPELIKNTRYEGHPLLWNLLLFVITRFSWDPFCMQLLHIGIATSAVYIFLRKAPFTWFFKALFIFGYFMVFEYNLISRNYMLGVLFLFLACSFFKNRNTNFVIVCILLALAANTHLMFAVVSFAFFLLLLVDRYAAKTLTAGTFGYLIYGFGIVMAAIQVIPADDTIFFMRMDHIPLAEKFSKGFITLFKGLATLPDFRSIHFWNSNFFVNESKIWAAIAGIFVYAFPLVLFAKNKKILYFVYVALFGLQVFFFVTQMSATRYDGAAFIVIVLALWLEHEMPSENYRQKILLQKFAWLRGPIIYGILLIHFSSGILAYVMDCQYPFSGSKKTAEWIEKNTANIPIACASCEGTSLSPYLKRKLFFLCNGNEQSYCRWNTPCVNAISETNFPELLLNYPGPSKYIAILYSPLHANKIQNAHRTATIRLLNKFDENIIRGSNYYIYEILRTDTILP